jgi:hypothetical protein
MKRELVPKIRSTHKNTEGHAHRSTHHPTEQGVVSQHNLAAREYSPVAELQDREARDGGSIFQMVAEVGLVEAAEAATAAAAVAAGAVQQLDELAAADSADTSIIDLHRT